MTDDDPALALLSIPNARERQTWLVAHPEHFCLDTVRALKVRADWVERDDARQALQIGQTAEEVAEALDDDEARGLAVWAQANAHELLAEYESSVEKYESAASLFLAADQPLESARTRIGQISALAYLGKFEMAQALAESARQVLAAAGDIRAVATIDMNLGNLYARRGQPRQALDYFQQALTGYQALSDDLRAAFAQVNQANVLTLLDDFVAAGQFYLQAREVFDSADLRSTVAMVDHDIAFLLYARGQYAAALKRFESARTSFTALAIPAKIAYMDLNESDVYLDLNLPEDALRLAWQAEHTFRAIKMDFEMARSQLNQAAAVARLGEHNRALTLLREARELFMRQDNEAWLSHADLQQAEVLSRMGAYHKAHALAMYVAEAYQRLGLKTKQAYASLLAADLFVREGRWATARDRLEQVRFMLADLNAPWLICRLETSWGQVNEGLGRTALAIESYRRAAQLAEQMAATIPAEEQRTAFVADKQIPYEGLVALTAASDPAEAFGWAERAKSRALVDLLAAGVRPRLRVTDDVDTRRADRLRVLREELNWLYSRLTRGAAPGETGVPVAGPDVWAKIQAREQEVTALWHDLQAKHAEEISLERVTLLPVADIQANLPAETRLVEYFIARDEVCAFVVSRDRVTVYPGLVRVEELHPLLESLSFQIAKGQYGPAYVQRHRASLLTAVHQVLSKLFEALLAPLWPELSAASSLIIVPHGPLHRLPFHALEVNGRPVIDTHAVSYAPSAAVLKFCRDRQPPRQAAPLLVGVPDDRIARVGDELRAVAQLFPDATSLIGASATVDQLRQHAPQCGWLHLATHGLFRPEAPLLSGLQLADRWLTVQDIYDLPLNVSLVTISACESGLSGVTGGDDLVGLVRGFLYAGAASMLASLWMVDDEAMARLMIEFYRAWQSGVPKARALQQVQRAFWEEYQHPFYWAPLT
ncbi:MAG TPA: CHAT domain-containing tetratricopeptide repeat protein, partial [Anaerolineae bacterium]|nr:CHAT domain-containing tetratricopeptide repeat protein [Anaerolineae bacterium]